MSLISKKNQITLPVEALREAGLGAGDDVSIQVAGPGRLEVVKTDMDAVVDRYAGRYDSSVYPPGYLEDLRREWER